MAKACISKNKTSIFALKKGRDAGFLYASNYELVTIFCIQTPFLTR